MDLGIIGIDSSHAPEFTRRMQALHRAGKTPCRVSAFVDAGDHGWPVAEDVERWKSETAELGAEPVDSIDALLERVEGVLVLAVDGSRHLELALPGLERGLPTYVDKPLTCDVEEAKRLLAVSRERKARCYSASSLRFATEVEALDRAALGELVAIDAYGPGELNAGAPGLFHYGVHTIELVDAVWGPGASRVSAIALPDRHLVDIEYRDGRYARLRLERRGAYDFGATVHGTEGVAQFRVDFGPVYDRLVAGMARFFEGGVPPAPLRDIVENVAVMAAGNESVSTNGAVVAIPNID